MIKIRQETPKDFEIVEQLILKAFENVEISDKSEHQMVKRLRSSAAFIPKLSLVAELDLKIVGHILLSKITLADGKNTHHALALALVSVLPKFQNQGVGSALIKESHSIAKKLNHHAIILIGHEDYYPRFGYKKCVLYHIEFPFEVPEKNCMVIEITEGKLNKIRGTVHYPKAFFENEK